MVGKITRRSTKVVQHVGGVDNPSTSAIETTGSRILGTSIQALKDAHTAAAVEEGSGWGRVWRPGFVQQVARIMSDAGQAAGTCVRSYCASSA